MQEEWERKVALHGVIENRQGKIGRYEIQLQSSSQCTASQPPKVVAVKGDNWEC